LGFIISAVITWVLAGRLGLIPDSSEGSNRLTPTHFGTGTRSGDNQ
jgi:hypothetical protein